MMKKVAFLATCSAIAIGVYAANYQPKNPLSSTMDAYVINIDSKGKEVAYAADNVEPGETIEYRLTYENHSDDQLSGIVVTGPIPSNTSYLPRTAISDTQSSFLVSIDGGRNFESEPVKRIIQDENGASKEIVIPPGEYTHVRWNVDDELAAGQQKIYSYRVAVK